MEDENVVITVSDTGHGMPEEVKRRLFDPFFSTKGVKGTGLGMSIVYGIITRHGGDIRVTSQEGEGTTFSIVLPGAGDGEVEQESSESRILARSGEGRILVVDDEEHIRDLVRDILSQAGFDVEVVAGGAEAIDSLRMAPFDLVVTDLGMPNVSGWEVSKAAKSMQADIRVLLLTGWGAALDSEEVARAGVDQTLAKPFKMVDLLHRAHQMLDGTRLRRSA
jgi:CheY-like chemotaxis protein